MTSPSLSPNDPFRVVIVGAGVAGLTLAHALDLAGIDYVLVDKGVVAPPWGISITLHPHACRILHQINCFEAVSAQCTTMELFCLRGPDGKVYHEQRFFEAIRKRTGYTTLTLERRALLRTLYDKLRDKSRVIERCRVQDIQERDGKVHVLMADGSKQTGDLVVGTDGVHSVVRELMWKRANEVIPHFISAAEKRSIVTSYNALIAMCPMQPGLGLSNMHCVSNDKFSFLILCQPDTIYFVAHCKLPGGRQTRWPNRERYTQADIDELATKLADYPLSESLLFGELWKKRTRAHLVSLEEGVLEHWFFGRTVLAGDSVHKVTPNAAFGGATAMESAVDLANSIHRAVTAHPNKKPSDVEIRDALQGYENSRRDRVKEIYRVSWMLTRLQAYDGWLSYIAQRWVLPLIGLDFVAKNVAQTCSEAPKLEYVFVDEDRGSLGWKDSKLAAKRSETLMAQKSQLVPYFPLLFGAVLMFSSVAFVFMA